jgi:hypothetical protein
MLTGLTSVDAGTVENVTESGGGPEVGVARSVSPFDVMLVAVPVLPRSEDSRSLALVPVPVELPYMQEVCAPKLVAVGSLQVVPLPG